MTSCLNKTKALAVFITAAILNAGTLTEAAMIDNVGVLTEQTGSYTTEVSGASESEVRVSVAAPLGSFTHDFSTLGETDWTVTWQAPAGSFIEIAVPTGFDLVDVQFIFAAGITSTPSGFNSASTSSVTLVPGSPALPLSLENVAMTGPGGDLAQSAAVMESGNPTTPLVPSTAYRFASVSLTATIPDTYDINFNSAIGFFYIDGFAVFGGAGTTPPDPGQWIRIVSTTVPEPSSLALLAFGGLAMLKRHRKQ